MNGCEVDWMAQVLPSSYVRAARADSLVSQLAAAFRLVSSRSARRSLHHHSCHHSHCIRHIRRRRHHFCTSNRARRLSLPLAHPAGLTNSTWRVCFDVAVVLVASTAYTIASSAFDNVSWSRVLSTTFDAFGGSNGPPGSPSRRSASVILARLSSTLPGR